MKKLLALALALVMVLGAASAFADYKVAFSQIGQESDWRTANTDSIKAAIENHEGWELIYDDAQQKQENQIKALRNFITQGVDVILFTGVVSTGWEEVLKEVNDEGIPLILVDRLPDCIDQIDYVAAFGGHFVEEGRRQVAWAGEYLKSLGRDGEDVAVAIMEGTTGASAQVGRTEGNLAAIEAYPNMKVVGQQSGNFTRAEGQALMESWLKSIDKIDVLIAQNDDPLAEKNLVREEDLYGRTLMVGGGSPDALRAVQHRLVSSGRIDYFNSADHDTTLTNVAAGKGVCLAPGFLNDHSGQFAWIPFDCKESFSCVLCTHRNDNRQSLAAFISQLKALYKEAVAVPF